MARTAPRRHIILAGFAVVSALALSACFGGDDGTEGPTTDTGGAGSNTVVTLAPLPPPVTAPIVQPPTTPPQPPTTPPQPPTTPPEAPIPPTGPIYTIEQGDTLYSIARKFGISVDSLIEVNNIANPDVIRAGDQLFIPLPQ